MMTCRPRLDWRRPAEALASGTTECQERRQWSIPTPPSRRSSVGVATMDKTVSPVKRSAVHVGFRRLDRVVTLFIHVQQPGNVMVLPASVQRHINTPPTSRSSLLTAFLLSSTSHLSFPLTSLAPSSSLSSSTYHVRRRNVLAWGATSAVACRSTL